MTTRTEIRALFHSAVKSGGLTAFSHRHIDKLEDSLPAGVVFIERADVTQILSHGLIMDAGASVTVCVRGDDDELDAAIDEVIDSVYQAFGAQEPTIGLALQSIEYDRDTDPGINIATTSWTVSFNV